MNVFLGSLGQNTKWGFFSLLFLVALGIVVPHLETDLPNLSDIYPHNMGSEAKLIFEPFHNNVAEEKTEKELC